MKTQFLTFAILFSFTLISCKKENKELPVPANSTSVKNAKTSTVTGMCPNSILLNGNSPGGNKLSARFDPANAPASIVIVQNGTATQDMTTTAGNSGQWISSSKYTSTELGLNLFDPSGNLICTCNYDANGNLKANALPLQILAFNETIVSEGVQFTWTVQGAVRASISGYGDLTAQELEAGTLFLPHAPTLRPPFTLTVWDASGNKLEKTIMACTLSSASAIVTRGPKNVYGHYTENPVTITWHSTQEENIVSYVLYRFSASGNLDQGWPITPTGAGSDYSVTDNEAYGVVYTDNGDFLFSMDMYQIHATFEDGRSFVIKELTVTE